MLSCVWYLVSFICDLCSFDCIVPVSVLRVCGATCVWSFGLVAVHCLEGELVAATRANKSNWTLIGVIGRLDLIVLLPFDNMEEILDSIGSGNVIIVDNLPIVPSEIYKRLEDFLTKRMFCDFGVITHFSMPRDESSGMTKGRAFIKYSTPEEAQCARAEMNGRKLNKSCLLSIVIAWRLW